MRDGQKRKKDRKFPSEHKDEILNVAFVVFLQETKLERLLSLSSGAWRGLPGPALQILPGVGWELGDAVFLTS